MQALHGAVRVGRWDSRRKREDGGDNVGVVGGDAAGLPCTRQSCCPVETPAAARRFIGATRSCRAGPPSPCTPQSLPCLQVSLQDARSRAQIELPEAATQALLRLHGRHAPDKLPLVEGVLRKMAGGAAGTARGAGAAEGDGGQDE